MAVNLLLKRLQTNGIEQRCPSGGLVKVFIDGVSQQDPKPAHFASHGRDFPDSNKGSHPSSLFAQT